MPHHIGHLLTSVAALLATLAIITVTANALVRRKLRLSLFLLTAYLLLHVVLFVRPQIVGTNFDDDLRSVERLALAAALINLVVVGLINPCGVTASPTHSRQSCRTPSSSGSWRSSRPSYSTTSS
jgi:hypothetical protein